ncbi:MAG: response regulator [Phycisphaerales bacterium]
MRTLLVDDSKTMCGIVRSILSPLGLNDVEEAEDTAEARAALDVAAPGLVVIDGGLDGALDLVREARGRIADLPIVMISADPAPVASREAKAAGASVYVVKPFTPDVLSQRIAEAVDGAGARSSRAA